MAYFADTWYWAALLNRQDQHHQAARDLSTRIGAQPIVTSQLVMMELFAMCSRCGNDIRRACCRLVAALSTQPNITIVPYSGDQYDAALLLYEQVSNDKEWSLVDCSSFLIMEKNSITVAISGDHHFEQRGFTLFR